MAAPFKTRRNQLLNQLYREFNFKSRLSSDPVGFLQDYSRPLELEIAAFLSSALAFGRIELFKPVIRKILDIGKEDLAQFVLDFKPSRDIKLFKGVYYRIWTETDLAGLIFALKTALTRHGSLENLFLKNYDPSQDDLEEAMVKFSDEFFNFNPSEIYRNNQFPGSFKYFVPSPRSGSACKRFCLFLRWMVRKDDIDVGIWKTIEPAKLIIPLDTHIFRMAQFLKLTKYKTAGWKTAKEITRNLKEIDPVDPLKFDFPLCHFSIRGICPVPKPETVCALCTIRKKCYFNE